MHSGIRGIPGNRICETGHAFATIEKNPAPEVGAFGGSAEDAERTSEEREVQQNDRIRRTQPHLDRIIRAKITIQDPLFFLDEALLQLDPLNTGSREQAGSPEDLIEFTHRQARDLAQLPRKRRLPGRSATEYDHALHKRSFRPTTPDVREPPRSRRRRMRPRSCPGRYREIAKRRRREVNVSAAPAT